MLLAFTNASCIRTGFTNCRESPEAGGGLGAQGALSGTTLISGFSAGTLSVVALGILTCFSAAALDFAAVIFGKSDAVFATLWAWEEWGGDLCVCMQR